MIIGFAVVSIFCEEVSDAVFERSDDGWVHDSAVAGPSRGMRDGFIVKGLVNRLGGFITFALYSAAICRFS
jgi:hypothetical protein